MLTKGQPIALLRVHRLAVLGWDTDAEKGCDNTSYVTKSGASIAKATADGLNPTKSGTPQGTKHGAKFEHDTPHGTKPTGPGANPSSKLA
jgi:hypothetical protein